MKHTTVPRTNATLALYLYYGLITHSVQELNAGTVHCTYPVDSLVDLESDGALGLGDGGTARGVHRETRQLSRQLKHMELGTEMNTARENEKHKIV